MMRSGQQQMSKARRMNISIDEDQSYLKCCRLLQEQFDEEQNNSNKSRKNLKIGIQKAQEHIELCKQERIIKSKQKKALEEQIKQLEIQLSKVHKKKSKQDSLQQSIQELHFIIEDNNTKLQHCKQKSYQQKSIFLQLQNIESNLQGELHQIQTHEKQYYQCKKRDEKYKQLLKLKQKLYNKAHQIDNGIQNYLKQKINVMSQLRTNLITLEQKLDYFQTKIEEQQYIIQGLKDKAEQVEETDDQIKKKYLSKYQDLYFNDRNNISNWKNYKNYLEELLKRNQVTYQPYQPYQPPQEDNYPHVKPLKNKTQPSIFYVQDKQDLPATFNKIRTPSRKQSKYNKQQLSNESIRLPRLIKISGRNESRMKQSLKSNIKKMLNQSDISLESIQSKDQNTSGQYIQVQYHKK